MGWGSVWWWGGELCGGGVGKCVVVRGLWWWGGELCGSGVMKCVVVLGLGGEYLTLYTRVFEAVKATGSA